MNNNFENMKITITTYFSDTASKSCIWNGKYSIKKPLENTGVTIMPQNGPLCNTCLPEY